jgi:hypothetical protein
MLSIEAVLPRPVVKSRRKGLSLGARRKGAADVRASPAAPFVVESQKLLGISLGGSLG